MSDYNEGYPVFFIEPEEQVKQLDGVLIVKRTCGFICQDNFRVINEGSDNCGALAFPP